MKFRSGISKCGTNPIWISGPATPRKKTYYQLYDTTARALEEVDSRLRVGGPATAQAAWVDRFIRHVAENNVPVDFVSTHVYANDLSRGRFRHR